MISQEIVDAQKTCQDSMNPIESPSSKSCGSQRANASHTDIEEKHADMCWAPEKKVDHISDLNDPPEYDNVTMLNSNFPLRPNKVKLSCKI